MKPKIGLKPVHLYIPDDVFGKLSDMEREGVISSFSDAGRTAIRDLLEKHNIYDMEKIGKYKRR